MPESGATAPSPLAKGVVLTSSKLTGFLDAHFEAKAEMATNRKVAFNHRPCASGKVAAALAPDETCTGRQAVSSGLGNAARGP